MKLAPSVFLLLLQVCDGNFPNGSFSHSFGLETLIEQSRIRTGEEFCQWLDQLITRQLFTMEGLLTALAWRAATAENLGAIEELDRRAVVSCFGEDTRRGMILIGSQTTKLLANLIPGKMMLGYRKSVEASFSYGVAAVALGVGFAESGVPCSMAVSAALYATIAPLVAAGVRAIPLGQTEGQRVLHKCCRRLAEVPDYTGMSIDDLSGCAYEWEIAQMNHRLLNGRLFMS